MKEAVLGIFERVNRQGDYEYLSTARRGQPDQLGFPGGKPEPGESLHEALDREAPEETDVTVVRAESFYAATDSQGYRTTAYYVWAWNGIPKQMEPDIAVGWYSREEMINYSPFSEYNRDCFEAMDRYLGRT